MIFTNLVKKKWVPTVGSALRASFYFDRLRREPTVAAYGEKQLSNRKYVDRPIDIDILLYDDLTVDEPDLKIPHPLMYEREFVMKPLREILTIHES